MMNSNRLQRARARRRGGVLLLVSVMLTSTAVLALCMTQLHLSGSKEQRASAQVMRCELLADAALSRSYVEVQNGRSGNLGSANAPVAMEGGSAYVTASAFGPSSSMLKLYATGIAGKAKASSELVLQTNADPRNLWACFGIDFVNLASQAKVDSYDSSLGTYAAQNVNGSGSNSYALSNGNIGSDGNVTMSQNSLVFGNAQAGPGYSTTVTGNAAVSGTTAPMLNSINWAAVTLPASPLAGNTSIGTSTITTGTHAYGATTISNNAQVTVTGPAKLVFDSLVLRTGSAILVNATNGPVEIYVVNNMVMNSNTTIHSNDYKAQNVRVNLLSDNIFDPNVQVSLDNVEFDSNSTLYGMIYAPTAAVVIDSNFTVYGGIISRRVDLRSNSRVHFDQALTHITVPGTALFTKVASRIVR
jgi:hypothetical protein